jgi:pyruvate ferredoxin oxidoreductase beta subunit
VETAKAAVATAFWPLFEVVDGEWIYTKRSVTRENRKPIEEFLEPQGRFKHLFKPGNEELLARVQAEVDRNFDYVLKRCGQ